ncbi:MAG TPA: acyl carrier protein [Bryobacteraceae bacterium]|nr:acyl carrier protein [Bryobacteraceae bacterium]
MEQKTHENGTSIESLRDLCRERLSFEVDSRDTDLFETGLLDSMTLVQLIMALEDRYRIKLPMQELGIESFRSLGAIADLLALRRAAPSAGSGL